MRKSYSKSSTDGITWHGSGGVVRRPQNRHERLVFDFFEAIGLTARKRGWPDFWTITNDGKFVCVEVKPDKDHPLRADQFTVLKALARHGVTCYHWNQHDGFTQVLSDGSSVRVDLEGTILFLKGGSTK